MLSEINNRTSNEKITLLRCIITPFTKDLNFCPDLREYASSYLRDEMGNVQVRIKTGVIEQEVQKPMLPTLQGNSEQSQQVETTENENIESVAKKSNPLTLMLGERMSYVLVKPKMLKKAEIQRYPLSKVLEKIML